MWRQLVKKELQRIKPDVVVCDFYTRVGCEAADELGIPSVVNVPGLIQMCNDWGFTKVIEMKKSRTCCGQICISQGLKVWFIEAVAEWMDPHQKKFNFSYNKRAVLFNSFWGLDEAHSIPPNYTLTGPLCPPQEDLL